MNEPIKAGDPCIVIAGALGMDGPNVGKRVVVEHLQGEHSQFGRIWRCVGVKGVQLVSEYGALGSHADFAQSWLRKLPPVGPHAANDEKIANLDEVTT